MAEYLAPGVYVEEFDSGSKAMEGVSSSTAGFIGHTRRGPVQGKPVYITGIAQYRQIFGGHLNAEHPSRFLSYAVEQFFSNGGSSCYIMRVAPSQDEAASITIGENTSLSIQAKSVGDWGNECHYRMEIERTVKTNILEKPKEGTQIYPVKSTAGFEEGDYVEMVSMIEETSRDEDGNEKIIQKPQVMLNRIVALREKEMEFERPMQEPYADDSLLPKHLLYRLGMYFQITCDDINEVYHVSLNPHASDFILKAVNKSILISADMHYEQESVDIYEAWIKEVGLDAEISGYLQGGKSVMVDDASLYLGEDKGPGKRSGLQAFKEVDDVSIMAIPGVCYPEVQTSLVAHCESMANRFAILDMPRETVTVDDMETHRSYFDSSYAAIYHPWLSCYDMVKKCNSYFPPSASMAGIYARVDMVRGVHKAPANETVRNCVGLSVNYNDVEQGKANPKGINLIRSLPGQGLRVWGARTLSSDASWKYVNVRRLFIYLEESIRANTNWAVFEPNDANLWMRVEGSIRMFLNTLWRNGALVGASEDEAFFVNIGPSTMTQDDILNGRLICIIGAAPVRPAEFVIFRITQKMQEA